MADPFITASDLIPLLGWETCPTLLDLRLPEDVTADPTALPRARVLSLSAVLAGAGGTAPTVVYCQKGGKISQLGAAALRERGVVAQVLVGGHLAWQAEGLPLRAAGAVPEQWIGALDPSWGEVLAEWALRRLIAPRATVLRVARDQVEVASSLSGISILPNDPQVILSEWGVTGWVWPDLDPVPVSLLRGCLARGGDLLSLVDDQRLGCAA